MEGLARRQYVQAAFAAQTPLQETTPAPLAISATPQGNRSTKSKKSTAVPPASRSSTPAAMGQSMADGERGDLPDGDRGLAPLAISATPQGKRSTNSKKSTPPRSLHPLCQSLRPARSPGIPRRAGAAKGRVNGRGGDICYVSSVRRKKTNTQSV